MVVVTTVLLEKKTQFTGILEITHLPTCKLPTYRGLPIHMVFNLPFLNGSIAPLGARSGCWVPHFTVTCQQYCLQDAVCSLHVGLSCVIYLLSPSYNLPAIFGRVSHRMAARGKFHDFTVDSNKLEYRFREPLPGRAVGNPHLFGFQYGISRSKSPSWFQKAPNMESSSFLLG